jgi:uncharacterized membrane protein YesL
MTQPKNPPGVCMDNSGNQMSGEFSKAFFVFLRKTYKEKKYFWIRNVFFTIFSIVVIILLFHLDARSQLEDAGIQQSQGKSLTFQTIDQVN